jgi:PKD repeat protein
MNKNNVFSATIYFYTMATSIAIILSYLPIANEHPMRKTTFLLILIIFFTLGASKRADACFSYFTYERACAGDTVWFHPIDPTAVYCWTFGDSTSYANVSFDQNPYHIYTLPGTYYVTLFTNIGAEWDYYTTVVEITSDCFVADYTWDCAGPLLIQFQNYSVGSPSSWTWFFDDPSSGVNDTSHLPSPDHTFTGTGAYHVQLIISDGLISDTIVQTVNVYADCLDASFAQTIYLPCWGDTFTPYPVYSGAITDYLWDFGDPFSGTNNTSTLADPIHVYWSPRIYTITLVVSNGIIYDTAYLYVEVVDCRLWPGDVNRDGEVNGDDIFGIGIYFGNWGPQRAGATTAFTPQTATDWPGFSNYMYLQDYLNAKYADCNGNGTIDATDVYPISDNFGQRSSNANNQSTMLYTGSSSTELGFATDAVDAWSGATVEAPVSLGITDSAERVYGFSMSIQYDPFYISWISADFFNSWLGTNGINMQVVTHDDPGLGIFSVAAVRIDKTTRSGLGEVVRLYLHTNYYPGTSPLVISPASKVISNGQYSWTTNQMVVIPVELKDMELNLLSGVDEYSMDALQVYPIPAQSQVVIDANGELIQSVEVFNMMGALVYKSDGAATTKLTIDISKLMPGVYELKVISEAGIYRRSLVKQ